jgi:hypothetical protein
MMQTTGSTPIWWMSSARIAAVEVPTGRSVSSNRTYPTQRPSASATSARHPSSPRRSDSHAAAA